MMRLVIKPRESVAVVPAGREKIVAHEYARIMNTGSIVPNPVNVKCVIRNCVIRRRANVSAKWVGVVHYAIVLVPS